MQTETNMKICMYRDFISCVCNMLLYFLLSGVCTFATCRAVDEAQTKLGCISLPSQRTLILIEVLSTTVAKALAQKGSERAATFSFVQFIDRFFDCLNMGNDTDGKQSHCPGIIFCISKKPHIEVHTHTSQVWCTCTRFTCVGLLYSESICRVCTVCYVYQEHHHYSVAGSRRIPWKFFGLQRQRG